MESESKRRRLNPPPRRTKKTDVSATGSYYPKVNPAQTGGYHFNIQQARSFAVSQAQHEGSTGNFKIFDSPFGNFMIPAVPTRAELAD